MGLLCRTGAGTGTEGVNYVRLGRECKRAPPQLMWASNGVPQFAYMHNMLLYGVRAHA